MRAHKKKERTSSARSEIVHSQTHRDIYLNIALMLPQVRLTPETVWEIVSGFV
jgi:hypothetical protein